MNYQRLIESGVDQWNQWRQQNPHQYPDLRGIDLTNSYLFEINLMGSDLRGADFRRACLIGANLSQADLSGANLGGAYLSQANFREANLSNANLIDAHMAKADLLKAILVGTCLEPAGQAVALSTQASTPQSSTSNRNNGPKPIGQVAPDSGRLEEKHKEIYLERQQLEVQACQLQALEQPAPSLAFNGNQAAVGSQRLVEKPFAEEYFVSDRTLVASKQAKESIARSLVWTAKVWSPALIEQCHYKLCDYYIGPMATLILDDIITTKQPQTKHQFIELVAAHIPVPQDALSFQHRFVQQSPPSPAPLPSWSPASPSASLPEPSSKPLSKPPSKLPPKPQAAPRPQAQPLAHQPDRLISVSSLTQTCLERCRQQLSEYYIVPMAQMLIDDVIAMHHPKTNRQFVQLVADHLPPDQVESFSRKVLF